MTRDATTGRRRRLRALATRAVVLAAAVAAAWPGRPQAWDWTSALLPASSPLVGLVGPLAARTASVLALLGAAGLALAWFVPRGLCRHVCPTGLLLEGVARLRPGTRQAWRRVPRLGGWLALAALAGAAAGYPLFLWLDPFALLNGALAAWREPLTWGAAAAGGGLWAVLLLEAAAPRLWCRRLCPLGGLQDGCAQVRRGAQALRAGRERAAGGPGTPRVANAGRRLFVASCGGAAGALLARRARAERPVPLRPPGALGEASFTGACVRCGNCAQACPTGIIRPDLAGSVEGWLAPRLDFSAGYCREDCRRCGLACPSGALARLPLDQKRRALIGTARIDTDTCLMALGRECNACVQACPYEAIAIAQSADGFSSEPRVDVDRCNGCGACEAACPVTPARAARVLPLTPR